MSFQSQDWAVLTGHIVLQISDIISFFFYYPAPRLYEIHLDFREKFIVESSDDCTYDFLEIRDGPFAYSPLIGRYCGNEFPPYIKSTSRFLWIRFKSDENVGKDGFAAVYSYVKKKGI